MSGVPYHAWTHRPKEEGGTDPIPGHSIAILSGWESIISGDIIPDTWQSVTSDGFFNDGYGGPNTVVNLDSGQLTFPTKTLVHIQAYAQFIGDFDEGDVVAVSISGTWGRIINAVTCDAAGVPGAEKIAVNAGVWHPTTPLTFELQVMHTHATDMTLSGAQITASEEAALADAVWVSHA